MSFWNRVSEVFGGNVKEHLAFPLAPHRVDVEEKADPIAEGQAYCRLWLVEMRLAAGKEFFKTRYPVVHSVIRFTHGNAAVTIPYLAGPGFLKELTKDNLDRIIQYNHPLTPLFPFNRGVVELQAGLFSMVANDQMDKFITTLGRFSSLLPVPQLSAVLSVAEPVYRGIEDLLDVGDGRLELGYHQTFDGAAGGSNHLHPGYFVAMLSTSRSMSEEMLCVVNDSLYVGPAGKDKEFLSAKNRTRPENCSYMLFRLDKRISQDWESLTEIRNLVFKAQEAVVNEDIKQANEVLAAIKVAIFRSPDLTKSDKRAMFLKINAELREWGLEAARGLAQPSLYAIMQRPMPPIDVETEIELSALESLWSMC
jgi:hypothetical protein